MSTHETRQRISAKPDNPTNDSQPSVCQLNDQFRRTFVGGKVVMTSGVTALGEAAAMEIMKKVAGHSEFAEDNDPHGEHDFGVIHHDGQKLFWKIDCYDSTMEYGSPDPADPSVTTRVLTVMLASEY